MIYITGDTHGNFSRIKQFCRKHPTTTNDVMIILGDAGINYLGDERDEFLKRSLSKLPITLFCIHGNHERRPSAELGYELTEFHGDLAYIQKDYPNIVFAMDGAVYDFAGHQCLVCGGAYFGHYHTEKVIDKMRFLFEEIIAFSPDDQVPKLAESEANSID